MSGPTVVKLGGSFALSSRLRAWIAAIAACAGRTVVVPGGGPFADAVRAAQVRMGFGDRAAHRMALLAMEQYGCALAALDERLLLANSLESIRLGLSDRRVPVWQPTQMAVDDAAIPQSWDVTSDSLAAWLAARMGAARLVLVKHVEIRGKAVRAADLAACDIVDRAFADFLMASGIPAFILGPDDCGVLRDGPPDEAGARIIA